MDPKWFPNTDRPTYDPNKPLVIALVTEIATLLLPSKSLRVAVGVPPLLWCAYRIRTHSAGKTTDNYLAAINLYWLILRWIDLALINQPESLHRHGDKKQPHNRSFLDKLKWSFGLCTTYRGVGWNWQVRNVDNVSANTSRIKFATIQLLKALRVYIAGDIVTYCLNHGAFPNNRFPDMSALSLFRRVVISWILVIRSVSDLSLVYNVSAALAVFLRLSNPEDWPPVFGSWLEMFTVRKAWGYCWHQFLRRTFEVYGTFITDLLKLEKGSLSSKYVKLYSAFLLSEILHHSGGLNCPWTVGMKYHAWFFWIQPFVITFEDIAIYIGRRLGIQWSFQTRLLGHVWVFFVFSFTLQMFTRSYFEWVIIDGGIQKNHPIFQRSLVEWLLG